MDRLAQQAILRRLKHSLQLLASPATTQLNLLPDFVCKGDELALEFDHWRLVTLDNYTEELSTAQMSALDCLHHALNQLTAKGSQHWTETAVLTSDEWVLIRGLAAKALEVFHWPNEPPPSYGHEYIGTDNAPDESGS